MHTAESFDMPRHEVLASGYQFLEAPRADARGAIWFSDLLGGGLCRRSADGAVEKFLPERKWIGGIVHADDGTVLCSGRGGVVKLDPATGGTRAVLSAIDGVPVDSVNDIEADAAGRLYGGTIDFTSIFELRRKPAPGLLFRADVDGTVRVVREGIKASNGIAFSPDGRIMYHAESLRGVWAYDVAADGWPRNPTMFTSIADCDGVAVDVEGGVWIARWESGELVRLRADATPDRRWRLPFPYLVSLTFAGEDLQDLIVVTGGPPDEEPKRGAVVRLRSEVPGLPAARTRI
jgi:D-xylonolactonase